MIDSINAVQLSLIPLATGSNFSVHEEDWYLGADSQVSTAHPPANCTVHIVRNYTHFQDILTNKWAWYAAPLAYLQIWPVLNILEACRSLILMLEHSY